MIMGGVTEDSVTGVRAISFQGSSTSYGMNNG